MVVGIELDLKNIYWILAFETVDTDQLFTVLKKTQKCALAILKSALANLLTQNMV